MSDELRASDAEREQAVTRLREASAEGRLTLEELAQRTGDAYAAKTHGELVRVTSDLPARSATTPQKRATFPGIVLGIFAPMTRSRRKRLPPHTIVLSVFAPTKLDLRQARLEGGTATIELLAVFAPVTIVVPRHVDLDMIVLPVFAPVRDLGDPGEIPAGAPHIRVVGVSVFAPVFVRYADS